MNGQPIESTDEVQVLGVAFTSSTDHRSHLQLRMQKCRRAFYALLPAGITSPGLHPDLKARLWKTACQPVALYGCEAIPLRPTDIRALDSLQGELVKKSIGIGKRSHHSALLRALHIDRMEEIILRRNIQLQRVILATDSPARRLALFLAAQALASDEPAQRTLSARLHIAGISVLLPDAPVVDDPAPDGTVDSLRNLLWHEHFIKPYSNELTLVRLLTRSF